MNIGNILSYVTLGILTFLLIVIGAYIDEFQSKIVTRTEKETIKLTTFLPTMRELYMINYLTKTITFVNIDGDVVKLPFEKLSVLITTDKDEENSLKLEYKVRRFSESKIINIRGKEITMFSEGEILNKDCKEVTVFQYKKEDDE